MLYNSLVGAVGVAGAAGGSTFKVPAFVKVPAKLALPFIARVLLFAT